MLSYRIAKKSDAEIVAELLTELGHSNSLGDISERWESWGAVPENKVWLASLSSGEIVGLAVAGVSPSLYRPYPLGRLWAFIVRERFRRKGFGRAFLSFIEGEFRAKGCGMIELTSNVVREDAHRFYEGAGYLRTSFRFSRVL